MMHGDLGFRLCGFGVWGLGLPSKDSYLKAFGPKDPIM